MSVPNPRKSITPIMLCVLAVPLVLAGCSSRKGEMMSALKQYFAKPGNALTYCADLQLPGQSTYHTTYTTTFLSYYAPDFTKTISAAHPIVYVETPTSGQASATGRKRPALVTYWLKHHFLATRTTTFHNGEDFMPDGSLLSPITVYVWKHRVPKGFGGIATIRESTGKPLEGLVPGFFTTTEQVPWITSYCGGQIKPVRIVSFTKPTAANGVTVSQVRVAFALHGIPSWFYAKPAQVQLGRGAPHRAMTRTLVMTQTSNGWSVTNVDGLVPLISTVHVAKFRWLAADRGF